MKESTPYIKEFKKDDKINRIFLVTAKGKKTTKQGKPYLDLELTDKTGQIPAKMWDDNGSVAQMESLFAKDDFIQVQGNIDDFQGTLQLKINSLKKVDPKKIDLSDFVAQTGQDIELLWAQILEITESIQNADLSKLVSVFLKDTDLITAFKRAPASIKHHQPYIGGLLEHTVKLLNLAQGLFVTYPLLNRDLLLVGILLHDIGKTKEYQFHLRPEHTDEGRLVGHTILGILMLEEKVKEIKDFPQDLLMRLRHLVVSHHGEKIYGTPVVPMTAEALAIHYLDNLDARMAEYYENIEKLSPDNNWTDWINSIERRFYRGKP